MAINLHALKHLILDKTQGTPFFMEEVVQTLVEEGTLTGTSGHYQLTPRAATQHELTLQIPTTVQGILAARIDRLAPDEKALLQQLAVVGRQFPLSLIRQVITQPEADLYRLLASLQHKEFLYEQPAFPESEYLFKHALTQDVAYSTVLQEQKKLLHERTGQVMEQLYKDKLEDYYAELAHHYQRSGNVEKAIEYLQKAGRRAAEQSAYGETIAHLTTALAILSTLPQTPERDEKELRLQLALGAPLVLTKGYPAPEVEATYLRARDLSLGSKDVMQQWQILAGLWRVYFTKGDLQKARAVGEQMILLVEQAPDSLLRFIAPPMHGSTLFVLGEAASARVLFEQLPSGDDPQKYLSFVVSFGVDPVMAGFSNFADVLWWLGHVDQAREKIEASLDRAQKIPRPFNLTVSLDFAARHYLFRREPRLARTKAEAAIALATEHGFVSRLALATMVRGRALVEEGEHEEGIAQLQTGLAMSEKLGARSYYSMYFSWLVEACSKSGRIEEGVDALTQAWKIVEQTGERVWEAELYRLKGELTLQQESQKAKGKEQKAKIENDTKAEAEAEACFLKAIEIAQKQQAKSLELRATMSLTRLWQSQGKHYAARNTLSEIYRWFTEGFDTKDLQEAKVLLEELSLAVNEPLQD